MTETIFRDDAYRKDCDATVISGHDNEIVLDRTVFYPMGGGQPGDSGTLFWGDTPLPVVDTVHGADRSVRHVLAPDFVLPPAGSRVRVVLDWDRRYRHMRMHTALHLLGAVLHFGVTGGNIGASRSRLDFDMDEVVDKEAVSAALQSMVDANYPVSCRWISEEELEAQPELVRTMSVQPPKGAGRVRLLEIRNIDLQPCGGTHVQSTGEVGKVRVSKVEKKGRHNRRVYIELD